jgi:hypothetical protein
MINKYQLFVNVLDNLRREAPPSFKSYYPETYESEKLNQARGKSFIHLFLKVKFGLLKFEEREKFITDDINDGGIDAYYIDSELKTIYFIQSKFRVSEKNFEEKKINIEELLAMDINRILDGHDSYENGTKYHTKIKSMISAIRDIEDIGKYRYEIILLTNVKEIIQSKLRKLFDYPTEIFNYEKTYKKLLLPLLTGSYYNASDLNIYINISDKNNGSVISYPVQTKNAKCEISILFVPLEEIAKILSKYKNSILKYNPRCYLDLSTSPINREINKTVIENATNEFVLYNNGITMLSDDTNYNAKIGQRDKAVLCVMNPQIINGGQTAYTLARIYEESLLKDGECKEFIGKEVLLRIITFIEETDDKSRLKLIEEVSNATNKQNIVTYADRHSNDQIQHEIQNYLFEKYGILYERKRGEFSEGMKEGYIPEKNILPRTTFATIVLATQGRNIKGNKIFKTPESYKNVFNLDLIKDYDLGISIYYYLLENWDFEKLRQKNNLIKHGFPSLLYVIMQIYNSEIKSKKDSEINKDIIKRSFDKLLSKINHFEEYALKLETNKRFFKTIKRENIEKTIINYTKYYKSMNAKHDLKRFFIKSSSLKKEE